MKKNIKVLYLTGSGRSGSTLLERMLGQLDGSFCVGELGMVWERSLLKNQLCGCGQAFSDCDFWRNVFTENSGFKDKQNIENFFFLQHKVMRTRHLPQLLSEKIQSTKYSSRITELSNLLADFYGAILQRSQAGFIVDSTKLPLYALLLSNIKNIDLHIIHLVRDSQAVAYSWQRKRIRPEIKEQKEFMPQYSSFKSSTEWNKTNYLSLLLKSRPVKYYLLRYEDLVCNPAKKINDILFKFEINEDISRFIKGNTVFLHKKSHTVSGNPIRFQHGESQIQLDQEWEKSLSRKDKIITKAVTFPLAKILGY